jgi:hypothetical protein
MNKDISVDDAIAAVRVVDELFRVESGGGLRNGQKLSSTQMAKLFSIRRGAVNALADALYAQFAARTVRGVDTEDEQAQQASA